jgi:hypothetical protein
MRLTVYWNEGAYTFWEFEAERTVVLEVAKGWRLGIGRFGKTMLLGPGHDDELSIEEALARGVARIAEC